MRQTLSHALIIIASIGMILLTTLCAGHIIERRQTEVATVQAQLRSQTLLQEQRRWAGISADSLAGKEMREEALATLGLLQQLHEQEERLWSYYNALDRGLDTHERLLADRMAYEARLAQHRQQLEDLRKSIDKLRPTPQQAPLSFTPADPDQP